MTRDEAQRRVRARFDVAGGQLHLVATDLELRSKLTREQERRLVRAIRDVAWVMDDIAVYLLGGGG